MSRPIPLTVDGVTYPSKTSTRAAKCSGKPTLPRPRFNVAEFRSLVVSGIGTTAIAKQLGIHENTVLYRCKSLNTGLPSAPLPANVAPIRDRPACTAISLPATAPEPPLQALPHYPAMVAALERARGTASPERVMGVIAAQFRMPRESVQRIAQRAWA